MRLTEERRARGWSRAELARRAGMHSATISMIENGRFRPYRAQLLKLAHALGWRESEADLLVKADGPSVG